MTNHDASTDAQGLHGSGRLLVVGVGASAGGIQSLKTFFENVDPASGASYVVIDELSQSSDNLRILVNSTNIATIFLDRAGRVHLFSPAVREVFNVHASDIGRPLADIATKLVDVDLTDHAMQVLETLASIEREVRTIDERIFLMRVLPYRTSDDRIQGTVATFTDITERKRAEEAIAADLRDTSLLRELGVRLIQPEDIESLYDEIVVAAIRLTGADAGSLQILDSAPNELRFLATQGLPPELVDAFPRVGPASGTSCGCALAARRRCFADYDDVDQPDPDGSRARHLEAGLRSAQSTPLIARSGALLGMLSTHWRRRHRPTERELRFLDLLARQAADFFEQRQSAAALAASEERLQAIANLVPDLLWSNLPSGHMDWQNQAWYDYSGQRPERAKGEGWLDILHPDERESALAGFQQALAAGDAFEMEHRLRSASGEFRWFLVHARPLRDASGTIVRWFGSATDIHALRMAHEALRQSEERLRLTFESVIDYAIFTSDATGRIDSWNVGAQRMFGFTEAEAIGQSMAIIFTPEDREAGAHIREMQAARDTGRAADERWHIRKDGSRFYVSGVLVPLRDGPIVRGYAKVARDLTEQKAAGDALERAHEELENKVAERTRELAAANTSLRAEILDRGEAEKARLDLLRQLVEAQEAERRRISRELHDQLGQQVSALTLKLAMLRTSRSPGTSKMRDELASLETIARKIDNDLDYLVWELRPTALDDLGLVEALNDYVATWSRYFGIAVTFEAEGMEGARLEPEIETVIYRIAQEGLNNISKHARASGVRVALLRNGGIRFAVADDGIGFDSSQPFGAGAKGLGLVGMRERAALVGGTVDIQSQSGKGTTIVVNIPVASNRPTRSAGRKKGNTK